MSPSPLVPPSRTRAAMSAVLLKTGGGVDALGGASYTGTTTVNNGASAR